MHLHFDCFSGVSGDMILGALVDAGLSPQALRKGLPLFPLHQYRLKITKVYRGPIHATKVDVLIKPDGKKPLSWPQIQRHLKQSSLPPWVKSQAVLVFSRLAQVEGKVHGKSSATIHFHEVGVIDSLVDVVGSLLGCHLLGIKTFSASSVNIGAGTVMTEHGELPVPAPAVAELAIGVPIFSKGPQMELTTPTGMAIVTCLTQQFEAVPPIISQKLGYGAGTANPEGWPNVLRVFLGQPPSIPKMETDQVILLEANIDDMNPQLYGPVMDRLFEGGAFDVTLTPLIMKRGRPGILLSVIAPPSRTDCLSRMIFQETTTIGLRTRPISRLTLARSISTVKLAQGTIRVKTSILGNQRRSTPEFQDCLALAVKSGRPVREVMEEASLAIRSRKPR